MQFLRDGFGIIYQTGTNPFSLSAKPSAVLSSWIREYWANLKFESFKCVDVGLVGRRTQWSFEA